MDWDLASGLSKRVKVAVGGSGIQTETYNTSFRSTNVKLRLRFDVHLTFT